MTLRFVTSTSFLTGKIVNLLFAGLFIFLAPLAEAQTADNPNYPVVILDREMGFLAIIDEIDLRTPLALERSLAEVPNASAILLNSPGGNVHSALTIASRVRSLGLVTVVPTESSCMSACALVFFAGAKRMAWGKLGVHQISPSNKQGSFVGGQFALADIIEAMNEYNVPSEVVGLMLRTPPEDMYIFSSDEIRKYGFLEDKRNQGAQELAASPTDSQIKLSDPETWRGKTITGRLVASGKRWYATLNSDGSTVFQFTSGQRSRGRYYVSNGAVCFKLDASPQFTCRTPLRRSGEVRWYTEDGSYQSVIVGVDEAKINAINPQTSTTANVADYIKPGHCALIVASRPTAAEARRYILANVSDRRFLKAFRSKNGWVAISIGTLEPHEVNQVLQDWKSAGRIPQDSYCSTGSNYTGTIDLSFD